MSLRRDITENIQAVIREIEYPQPVLVTAEPFEVTEIAITQFPAILITAREELRNTISMGAPGSGRRSGEITYELRCFVRGVELDRQRNELLEALEEALDSDRYRDQQLSVVSDSQITRIEVQDRQPPLAEFTVDFTVTYNYLRGTV